VVILLCAPAERHLSAVRLMQAESAEVGGHGPSERRG
jgi:hypothetical protein